MALVSQLYPRYRSSWNNTTKTWSTPTVMDLRKALSVDKFRSSLVKTPKGKWRKPTSYERREQFFSGCKVVLDCESVYIPLQSSTRIMQTGYDDFDDMIFPSLPVYPQNLEDRTVNEALSSLKNQKIHLGVAFGERKQTAKFVTETVLDTVKLLRAVRRGDVKAVKEQLTRREKKTQRHHRSTLHEVLDAPSNLLLQGSYAVKPLVADVYGASETLNDADRADPERYATKTKVTRSEKIWKDTQVSRLVYQSKNYFQVQQSGFHGCTVRLDYYIRNPFLSSLAGLGVTNPLEIAWELVPFSFVADWFLPVGKYLNTLDATAGLDFRGGSITRLTKCGVDYQVSSRKPTRNSIQYEITTHQVSIEGMGRQMYMNRQALTSSPVGRLPSFKNPFSYNHLGVALALLTQLTNKR